MNRLGFAGQHVLVETAEVAEQHRGGLVLQNILELVIFRQRRAKGHGKVVAGEALFFVSNDGRKAVIQFAGANGQHVNGAGRNLRIQDISGIQHVAVHAPTVMEHTLHRREAQAEQQRKSHDPNDIFFHEKNSPVLY